MTPNARPQLTWFDEDRRLPAPGWPAERAAPGDLELVRRFCNTVNRENGEDRFLSGRGFDEWLVGEDLPTTRPSDDDLAKAVAFREALHEITRGTHRPQFHADAWRALVDAVDNVTFRLAVGRDGLDIVAEAPSRTSKFLGGLALICRRAHADESLRRLKSCSNCEWTIYDTSKNNSGRWCSMYVCGGRHNARAYRRRRRDSS